MTVYNTAVPVVRNVLASSSKDAIRRLSAALSAAGFDVLGAPGEMRADEAEAGTEADDL